MATAVEGALSPVVAIALVGVLGIGAQWLAWRLRMPGIVLMLLAGVLAGPVFGVLDPARDIGALTGPIISLAVAVILFEGGLTLSLEKLREASTGVKRLVVIGAPLGWIMSTLALRFGAGLSWESASVFGGIMIVTGPTVIAPLLRSARLAKRPAALLQWEAIVNDPIGALCAVLAFGVVVVLYSPMTLGAASGAFLLGVGFASVLGLASGYAIAWAFANAKVPDYMKVPVLLSVLLAVFALSDSVMHESGLLAVTVMGVIIANANLASYVELLRFKEHATLILVSGVFILLAASLDFGQLAQLDWRAGIFVAAVVLIARPVTVWVALWGTDIPRNERLLVALTGPRGVVLVAVAGLFGERLAALGVEDGALIGPLAFVLVAATVVLHGFTLGPLARMLNVTASGTPGVLLVGGSRWSAALGEALQNADIPVLISDPNRNHLRYARELGVPVFFGDILSEGAEHRLDMNGFGTVLAATDNDAYNTLVATDLAPEFGRSHVFQIAREQASRERNALPPSLGGRVLGETLTWNALNRLIWQSWRFKVTPMTEQFTFDDWRAAQPDALALGMIDPVEGFLMVAQGDLTALRPGCLLVSMSPPDSQATKRQLPA